MRRQAGDGHQHAIVRASGALVSRARGAPYPGVAAAARSTVNVRLGMSRLSAYVALTKPRIIELLLVTTLPTMVVAQRGMPPVWLMAITLLGGALAAGGANAINMVIDRDIDAVMKRTQDRPLVTGVISARGALIFAITLELAAFALLWLVVNPLSACLALGATAFYVFVYSLWLKRSSVNNIVIGGAAGAVPVLVGWTAVQNKLSLAPILLFGVIFAWTPPHFWALAIKYRDDYSSVDVPMMPSVRSVASTARQIAIYTVILWVTSLAFAPAADMGLLYTGSAIVLGAVFMLFAVQLQRDGSTARAMRLFSYSITYVTLLFGAMAVDQLIRGGS
ncbi:MAG TPA: heme o synthase [Acidimicrobiales bacterium]|nr:heme o synthase [Acidimicrobiales bacterium]